MIQWKCSTNIIEKGRREMGIGLDYYCKQVDDIEKERNRLLILYYSKNIYHFFNRKYYKEIIDKYDELLMHCYQFIEKQIFN